MFGCIKPFTKKVESNIYLLPCGKCVKCYNRRISQWSHRLMQEEKVSTFSSFITLTYDTEHVPISGNGFMNLCKRDVQLFMKRLRKINSKKLKYFLCGEYGGKTKRPHYHIILFNANIKTIEKAWTLGQVHYGKVEQASIGYTLKYMSKASKIPMHDRDDRQKEFQLMSKGLGESYVNHMWKKWHLKDLENRVYCNLQGGYKVAMPRYYKDRIYNKEQRGDLKRYWTAEMYKKLEEMAYSPEINEIMKDFNIAVKHDKNLIIHNSQKRDKL